MPFLFNALDDIKSRNYSIPFNQCGSNLTVSDDNIFIPDYISPENSHLWYWIWILPMINLIYAILRELDQRNKLTFMSKVFGPPIKFGDFWKGPKLP